MDKENKTTLPETGEPNTPEFCDPEFDAAISKAIVEALDANNAVPDNGGARFLMVTITLAEYRQLCRDSEACARVQVELWERTTALKAEIASLQAEIASLQADKRELEEQASIALAISGKREEN